MRIRPLAPLAAVAAVSALALGGCSLMGSSTNASTSAPAAHLSPSAPPSSYSPLAGPVEPASALPKACPSVLTTAQLQAVFGPGMPIGDNYGSYAALPSIGRTGRIVCVFGVGIDSFGQQSAGAIEVSIATYTSASDAVGRAADTVQSDSEAGATTAPLSVGGHPATLVVEQTAVGASKPPAANPSSAPPTAPGAGAATTPAVSTSSTAGTGLTELVMADGNRTFVLQVPFTQLSAQKAATSLPQLALDVYQNTMPASTSTTPAPSSSAHPSAPVPSPSKA